MRRSLILAAGGIVTRPRKKSSSNGKSFVIELLLIHRPGDNDWSFPKGKLDPGETSKRAARREVLEETGYCCKIGDEVGSVEYSTENQKSKRVTYYAMTVDRGSFVPNGEVDEIRWVTPKKALKLLTWRRDVDLLKRYLDFLPPN